MRAILLALALLVAGCADPQEPAQQADDDFGDVEVDDDTGAIRGVVVNEAIVPIAQATVKVTTVDPPRETETDAEGRFSFGKMPPGTHILSVEKFGHGSVQATATVEAGVADPPIVRVQMKRLFDQDPYMETQYYQGHIGCAYAFGVSSTCVNDYTRLDPTGTCPGGCAPFVTGIIDQREFQSTVGPGWQSIVWEMAWDSSVSGTSDALGITVSYKDRIGAGHWYASRDSGQPYRMQVDVGVNGPNMAQSNGPAQILPEGQEDLWNMIKAGNGNVAVEQDVEVFQSNFYYASSPEGWSLVAGDDPPF